MAVVTTQQKVAALYTAIFNRAPDQAGLNFWTAQIDAGKSFASVAAGFAQHEVFTTGIGALDNAGYVSALYTNILGSAGDTAGIAYWTARLAAGESKAAIVAEFVNGSLTIDIPALLASGGISAADAAAATIRQQTLTNKADVGIYFANTLGAASNLNPATVSTSKAGLEADPIYKASQAAIAGVDSTAASVTTAKDAVAVAAGSANPAQALLGHTFTLTTGADTFVGGASADVFNALSVKADGSPAGATGTLGAFDSIDGGAGKDTLNIYSDGTANVGLKGATVKNVETININNTNAGFGAVDASQFVGATAINQINVAGAVTNLAAGTTAGFNGIVGGTLGVSAAATAATASVALTGVKGTAVTNVVALNVGGAALNAVNVSGNIVQNTTAASSAVPATQEKQTIDFTLTTAVTADGNITVGGFTVPLTTAATTPALVASQVAAAINGQTVNGFVVGATVVGNTVEILYPSTAGNVATNAVVAAGTATLTGTLPAAATETTPGVLAVASAPAADASLALNVTAGNDVESVAVNTAVATTLTVTDGAGTKKVSTVDASASTGAVTYVGTANVANIKTGTGNDTATLATALTATVKAASISTGAGNDTVNVAVNAAAAVAGSTVTVDAGEGNDTINLTIAAGANVTYNVAAGAGDDIVVITGTVKTTDKIDGGAGTDTISLVNNTALVADDYIVFNKVLTNFETLKLTSLVNNLDADQLAANYSTVDLAAGSTVTNVGTQSLVAHGGLIATAKGYVAAAGTTPATYVGTLNITDKATGVITANADKVALTVDASANAASVTLAGDAQSASVTLVQALNTAKTGYVGAAAFTLNNTITDTNLAGLTLSGNGTASVTNAGAAKLVNVDASGLNSVTFDGKAAAGLTYNSTNTAAETIKLGGGIDSITLGSSIYGKVDTVTGLNLVAKATDAKSIDATSDVLKITNVNFAAGDAFKGFTTTQADLDLALKDAAAYAKTNGTDVAFYQGGNTYVLHDSGNGLIDAADTVVKITGQVNLDLLASSVGHAVA